MWNDHLKFIYCNRWQYICNGDVCAHVSVHSLDTVGNVRCYKDIYENVISKSVYIQADRLYKL